MVQQSGEKTTWHVLETLQINRIYWPYQPVIGGFLNHQQYVKHDYGQAWDSLNQ